MDADQHPVTGVRTNELCALAAILDYYGRHLWNHMAPSARRSRQQVELTALIVKLSLLPVGMATPLTSEELSYLKTSVDIFLRHVEEKLPLSSNRENILASCKQLRGAVTALRETIVPDQTEE